jgi:hypothetical protein
MMSSAGRSSAPAPVPAGAGAAGGDALAKPPRSAGLFPGLVPAPSLQSPGKPREGGGTTSSTLPSTQRPTVSSGPPPERRSFINSPLPRHLVAPNRPESEATATAFAAPPAKAPVSVEPKDSGDDPSGSSGGPTSQSTAASKVDEGAVHIATQEILAVVDELKALPLSTTSKQQELRAAAETAAAKIASSSDEEQQKLRREADAKNEEGDVPALLALLQQAQHAGTESRLAQSSARAAAEDRCEQLQEDMLRRQADLLVDLARKTAKLHSLGAPIPPPVNSFMTTFSAEVSGGGSKRDSPSVARKLHAEVASLQLQLANMKAQAEIAAARAKAKQEHQGAKHSPDAAMKVADEPLLSKAGPITSGVVGSPRGPVQPIPPPVGPPDATAISSQPAFLPPAAAPSQGPPQPQVPAGPPRGPPPPSGPPRGPPQPQSDSPRGPPPPSGPPRGPPQPQPQSDAPMVPAPPPPSVPAHVPAINPAESDNVPQLPKPAAAAAPSQPPVSAPSHGPRTGAVPLSATAVPALAVDVVSGAALDELRKKMEQQAAAVAENQASIMEVSQMQLLELQVSMGSALLAHHFFALPLWHLTIHVRPPDLLSLFAVGSICFRRVPKRSVES